MTDKLTEALAVYDTPPNSLTWEDDRTIGQALAVLAEAARRWASFPTDDDVEAAAKASMELAPGFDICAGGQWRVVMRAALEAVKREDR